jgi:hypothetical protein
MGVDVYASANIDVSPIDNPRQIVESRSGRSTVLSYCYRQNQQLQQDVPSPKP